MNTIHSMNAGIALGLAQKPSQTALNIAARPDVTTAVRRKALVLGLLAVASSVAAVLLFKSATTMNDLLGLLDTAYKFSSL